MFKTHTIAHRYFLLRAYRFIFYFNVNYAMNILQVCLQSKCLSVHLLLCNKYQLLPSLLCNLYIVKEKSDLLNLFE